MVHHPNVLWCRTSCDIDATIHEIRIDRVKGKLPKDLVKPIWHPDFDLPRVPVGSRKKASSLLKSSYLMRDRAHKLFYCDLYEKGLLTPEVAKDVDVIGKLRGDDNESDSEYLYVPGVDPARKVIHTAPIKRKKTVKKKTKKKKTVTKKTGEKKIPKKKTVTKKTGEKRTGEKKITKQTGEKKTQKKKTVKKKTGEKKTGEKKTGEKKTGEKTVTKKPQKKKKIIKKKTVTKKTGEKKKENKSSSKTMAKKKAAKKS